MRRSVRHDDAIIESLRKGPAFAAQYLGLSLSEGDQEQFLLALRRVTLAYGGVAKLARETGLNENTLHRTLSGKGNPRLSTIINICNAMGMRMQIVQEEEFTDKEMEEAPDCEALPVLPRGTDCHQQR